MVMPIAMLDMRNVYCMKVLEIEGYNYKKQSRTYTLKLLYRNSNQGCDFDRISTEEVGRLLGKQSADLLLKWSLAGLKSGMIYYTETGDVQTHTKIGAQHAKN